MAFDEHYQPININFEVPQRLYHLSGGLILLQGSNKTCWLGSRHSGDAILFSYLNGNLPDTVPGYVDTRVLGRTTFQHAEEMHDPITDNFALRVCAKTKNCLAYDQHTFWSGVSHRFSSDGLASNSLLASRVSTQIIKSTRRLERLSNAYRSGLMATDAPKEGTKSFSQNKYSAYVGNEFGSLLEDLYALRDALNAIISRICFNLENFTTTKMKKLLDKAPQNDLFDLIRGSMFDEKAGDVLIYKMSLYRSVAIHHLGTTNPIAHDSIFTVAEDGPLGPLVRLVYPLYDDLVRLEAISKGEPFDVDRQEFVRYAQKDRYIDALEFGYDSFIRLLRISEMAQQTLGLQTSTRVITDKDIIEATFTDKEGNKRHFKRNTGTGKLDEIS